MAKWFETLTGDENQPIDAYFEAQARAGDGQFAIAYALLGIARAIVMRSETEASGSASDAPVIEPR